MGCTCPTGPPTLESLESLACELASLSFLSRPPFKDVALDTGGLESTWDSASLSDLDLPLLVKDLNITSSDML
eukprot:1145827-Pelagomonas_calceolata.AAC.1